MNIKKKNLIYKNHENKDHEILKKDKKMNLNYGEIKCLLYEI